MIDAGICKDLGSKIEDFKRRFLPVYPLLQTVFKQYNSVSFNHGGILMML
jgi:hypothetical protein